MMIKITTSAGRAKEDPEKAVIPAITFVSTSHKAIDNQIGNAGIMGFAISLGWWDWYLYLGVFKYHLP